MRDSRTGGVDQCYDPEQGKMLKYIFDRSVYYGML